MKISETLVMLPAMLIAKIVSRTEATIFNNVDIPEINMMYVIVKEAKSTF